MTSLADRPNSAVIVIDVQNGVVGNAYQRDVVVASIGRLVEKAREARVPVLWVQDIGEDRVSGSAAWQIVPELVPGGDEPRIEKLYGDSFEDTDLEAVLARLGVGRVIIAGAQTDACIRSTLHGAIVRGVRHHAGDRCAHHRGPHSVGCAGAGCRHPAHQPGVAVHFCAWAYGGVGHCR